MSDYVLRGCRIGQMCSDNWLLFTSPSTQKLQGTYWRAGASQCGDVRTYVYSDPHCGSIHTVSDFLSDVHFLDVGWGARIVT